MSWSGLLKFFTGLFLAIALLAGGSVFAFQYFVTKLTAPPPKPIFPNDKPVTATAKPVATKLKPTAGSDQTPEPEKAVEKPAPKPLPPGAFEARVAQPIGLILRDSPSRDAGRIGGIDNNERVVVLETSADGDWQKVRVQSGDREGWVRAGNVEKTN